MKTIGDSLPRRFKAKASGSITAGKPLIVKSDGDVTQISATGGGPSVGSLFEADYAIAYNGPHCVYDTANDKVVKILDLMLKMTQAEMKVTKPTDPMSFEDLSK